MKLDILTFNIQQLPVVFGFIPLSQNNLPRQELFKDILKKNFRDNEAGFDLVFIQEKWLNHDEFADLGYEIAGNDQSNIGGLLILSKYKIKKWEFIKFHEIGTSGILEGTGWPYYFNKGFLIAEIEVEGQSVWLVNTHLIASYPAVKKLYIDERRKQILEIKEGVKKYVSLQDRFIFAGDFNCGPGSDEDGPQMKLNSYELLPNVFPGLKQEKPYANSSTFSVNNLRNMKELGKVDHIFFSQQFSAGESKVLFQEEVDLPGGKKDNLSDHYGLSVRLTL